MEKQTKNIITREWVEKELRFYSMADIKASILMCGILSTIFIALAVVMDVLVIEGAHNLIFEIVFCVLWTSLSLIPVVISVVSLCESIAKRKLFLSGEFDITTHAVSYKYEKVTRRNTILFLVFPGFKDRAVGNTTYFHAAIGDEFYIVHYRTNKAKKRAELVYSTKMYEYVTE